MGLMELAKKIMELFDGGGLKELLENVILNGTKLGMVTANADLKIEGRTEPDFESIVRIGMRANALSDSAIARAKGNFARESDLLYQEMDAALKAGMGKTEALGQIEGRFRGLFEDSYKDWEIERLVRDQFLVATKEGRRSGWQEGGVLWRQWTMHSDSRTGDDSKRMHGQIVRIDEPYTDPLTGKKYMIEQMRPNDRCFGSPLFELPKNITYRKGLMYSSDSMTKNADVFFEVEDFLKV